MLARRGFTLIELLVVIAIIATLAAIVAPVFMKVKSAVRQTAASRAVAQLVMATSLYTADHDDTYPVGMYELPGGYWQTWYGLQTGETEWDPQMGILGSYRAGKVVKDPSHIALPYMGDFSGFGYNYGWIGSDMHVIGSMASFPNCYNPATGSSLSNPSTTLVYATSSYYEAPWVGEGTGTIKDFGFVDQLSMTEGNPTVDFRHFGLRMVNEEKHEVTSEGRAIVAFADGNVKPYGMKQFKDSWFERFQDGE
jgi:prepilin-type N-terminal cleavage/methylation domain-containing protein/prepilin-type processing-associated H-X9-DG protein